MYFCVIMMKKVQILNGRARAYALSLTLCFASIMMAQRTSNLVTLPYSMSFEASGSDSVELASGLWQFNNGADAPNCTDFWEIGQQTRSDGRQSVYILHDSILLPGHGQDPTLQFFYTDMEFQAGKRYTISFDWMNSSISNDAAMYVGYFAYTTGTTPNSRSSYWLITANSTSGAMPANLSSANCTKPLKGATTWQNYTMPTLVATAGMTYRFYVAWANKGGVQTKGYAACFDNLQITDARCTAPSDVDATMLACDTMLVTWQGLAEEYDVKFRKTGTSQWSTASYYPSMGNSCIIEGLAEGSYEVRVRAIYYDADNQQMFSAFANLEKDAIVYCPDRHCIDYTTLSASNVTCATGQGYNGWNRNPEVAYETPGVVDFGSTDARSRHTTNWDRTAKDVRTGNKLKLVPDGALASVRLGNWNTNAEAESISYEYVVDSALSILLMKYAIVLEDPDHSANEQPRFTLEILNQNGERIDPTCGFVNFAADASAEGWHVEGDGYNKVVWKDWTTIGLHLDDYVGQTLTVRLATYDCSQSGHYGYAYFTLDCASATIESHSCGANFRLEASAPSGFIYEWADDHGNVVGREQEINILTVDSMEYTCTLTSTENENCWFQLSVMALPRFPMAQGTWHYSPKMCENIVNFRDSSYVQTRYYGDTINHYDQKMVAYEWEFLDGSGATSAMPNCQHTFPQDGGTYQVLLRTWLAEGEDDCEDVDTLYVTVPHLGDSLAVARDTICNGDRFLFWDKKLYQSGIYVHRDTAYTGCITTDSLYLFVAPTHTINLPDTTLCAGDVLCLGDTCYTVGKDGYFYPSFVNQYGCDSVVTVHIHFKDPVEPLIEVEQMSDSVDIATVYISGSGWSYYTMGDDPTHRHETMFQTTEDGKYELTFYSDSTDNVTCQDTATYTIIPPCLRGLIYQRWNDVLSIMNEETQREQYPDAKHYYSFTSYQWMRNGMPIIGANKSYYYVGESGEVLNPADTYTCLVTLMDGTEDETCEFQPLMTAPSASPAPARKYIKGGSLYIENGEMTYDAFGNRVK